MVGWSLLLVAGETGLGGASKITELSTLGRGVVGLSVLLSFACLDWIDLRYLDRAEMKSFLFAASMSGMVDTLAVLARIW